MTLIGRLIRLFHTVRYLRPVQIYYRLWFKFYRPVFIPKTSLELREADADWLSGAPKEQTLFGLQKFHLLNKSRELTCSGDWNNSSWEKLWLYNLHYFEDLSAHDANERVDWHRKLLDKWIKDNPWGTRGIGWDSYPLSLRIVNWIKWTFAGSRLDRSSLDSLAIQTRYLNKRIEYHLLGNHLFANAKSLVFAGAFFLGAEADLWLKKGIKIIRQELQEQVLKDGGHFERSPMYHGIFLEDLLDLINLARRYPSVFDNNLVESWVTIEHRMREWLVSMCHPDGDITFFNDAALDIANSLTQLQEYALRLGLEPIKTPHRSVTNLQDSGFLRVEKGPVIAFLDVGEIGPRYNSGHAHADTLSFELSVYNSRFLVNSGTSSYEPGSVRSWQRGTSAHNTISIDGQDSSEVWGGFRVARRAMPLDLLVEESTEEIGIWCSHDGYIRLGNGALHTRAWIFQKNGIQIRDEIGGTFNKAVAYYHFHPDVVIELDQRGRRGRAMLSSGNMILWKVAGGVAEILESAYHPRFGQTVGSKCLEITFAQPTCEIHFSWN